MIAAATEIRAGGKLVSKASLTSESRKLSVLHDIYMQEQYQSITDLSLLPVRRRISFQLISDTTHDVLNPLFMRLRCSIKHTVMTVSTTALVHSHI